MCGVGVCGGAGGWGGGVGEESTEVSTHVHAGKQTLAAKFSSHIAT